MRRKLQKPAAIPNCIGFKPKNLSEEEGFSTGFEFDGGFTDGVEVEVAVEEADPVEVAEAAEPDSGFVVGFTKVEGEGFNCKVSNSEQQRLSLSKEHPF